MNIFEKNLAALKTINPELTKKLETISTNSTFEVFANNDLSNANILDTRTNTPIYTQNPIDEIQNQLQKFEKYKLYKAHYFYGIGNGHLYKKLLENPILETIYLFEPEIELIYIALNLTDLSEEIQTQRLKLISSQEFDQGKFLLLLRDEDKIYFKTYTLHIHTPFYEQYHEDIVHVNKIITQYFSYFVNASGNDAKDELIGLKNFLQNLPTMLKNPTLRELEKKGKNTKTAVIVATGPSLIKQLPLLKEIQDHVTIISVDASLPILEKAQIKPDIVTSIERIALTGKFYEKTSKEFQKDIIFALTSVVDQNLLKNIKAGQLQLNMRPTGSHYYYMELDEWGYIGIGMSSANLAYELATNIGFEHIVLIGQDLAYGKDGNSHAKDHIFGENEVKHNDRKDDYITAYGGEGTVKTTWVWKLFLKGYEQVIAKNNQNGMITTINATEGGARIHGTIEMPFKEVASSIINKEHTKSRIRLVPLQDEQYQTKLKQSYQKIEHVTELGKNMQFHAKKLLKELTKIINKYQKYPLDTIHEHLTEKETKKIIEKIIKIRNKYYHTEFSKFFNMLLLPLISHLEYEISYWSVQSDQTKKERLQKNWTMILLHHEWCYRIIVNLDAILKVIEEKKVVLEEALELEEA